ncbi:NUDIX domain-containing protein [Kitasatospora purpeofusca]|uniref:NUDIX domain-containing protein n=1 Tax=Kitasatospora purpeofusca TaxID=67352 RepID=UPI0036C041A3
MLGGPSRSPGRRLLGPGQWNWASLLTRDDGRVMAVRCAENGTGEPLGGFLERTESVDGGLRREAFEETGIKVRRTAHRRAQQRGAPGRRRGPPLPPRRRQ